ncbi:hypothetical protein DNAM5_68 [Haloarcula californiae tailed virus 1]|uniref:Uncharacterized protein n=1 Tax=Haloarcula californiae tailed virus 1 TaxID=1273746 RepID=R4TI47_9CAUD|nr:hypothetical protein M202_gp057 [Haloarcula californiae tailed virus 1]AGM12021.1 hypothetical protein DNAM5_68 [Haloarcula californiae tailed virus 1]
MPTCLDCGESFSSGQRRGDSPMRYKGYYCPECEEKRRNDD